MKHRVDVTFHKKNIEKKDLEVRIQSDAGKIGTLLISKGNIEWLPKGNSRNRLAMKWEEFAERMKQEGKVRKVKKKLSTRQ